MKETNEILTVISGQLEVISLILSLIGGLLIGGLLAHITLRGK